MADCQLCGEPMPAGEEMFKFHGYSGACPKPPLLRPRLRDEMKEIIARTISRTKQPSMQAAYPDLWRQDISTAEEVLHHLQLNGYPLAALAAPPAPPGLRGLVEKWRADAKGMLASGKSSRNDGYKLACETHAALLEGCADALAALLPDDEGVM